jgi:hypothetical protein
MRTAAFLAGLLLSFTAAAQQVPNPVSQTQTYPWPAGTFKELQHVTVGGPYPSGPPPAAPQMLTGISGVVAKMVVPPTTNTGLYPAAAYTGWVSSASNLDSQNSNTVFFGGSFTRQDGANPYGITLTTCNCDGIGALAGTGHQFLYEVGYELDAETLTMPGAVAPAGQRWGFMAVDFSDTLPAGGAAAFAARNSGAAGGWHFGFYSEDGASVSAALSVGTQAFDPTVSNSQYIAFRARPAAGGLSVGNLQYQVGGNLIFFPPDPGAGGTAGVFSTTGHYGANAPAVSVSACGTSPVAGTSNDTRGMIQVGTGAGVILCTVTFGRKYAVLPTCSLSLVSNGPAITVGFDSLQPDYMRLAFSGNAAGQTFTYVCMQ